MDATAPKTYPNKTGPRTAPDTDRRQMVPGELDRPVSGPSRLLQAYAESGSTSVPACGPRTVELYRWLLARHIGPHLGAGWPWGTS